MLINFTPNQWHNSRGGGQGAECPPTLLTGKFLLTYGEKRGKEKRKNRKEKEGKLKKEGGKRKMEGGKAIQNKVEFFFFFSSSSFFLLFTFQNH